MHTRIVTSGDPDKATIASTLGDEGTKSLNFSTDPFDTVPDTGWWFRSCSGIESGRTITSTWDTVDTSVGLTRMNRFSDLRIASADEIVSLHRDSDAQAVPVYDSVDTGSVAWRETSTSPL